MRTEKRCAGCGHLKPIEEFTINGRTPEGRSSYCRPCHADRESARRQADPEKVNARRRTPAARARRNARLRARRASDPSYRQRENARSSAHARDRTVRARTDPVLRAAINERANAYQRRLRSASTESVEYWAVLIQDPCSYCGATGGEVDHIDPVSLGGEHSWENFTGSCGTCNRSKHNWRLLPFLADRSPMMVAA